MTAEQKLKWMILVLHTKWNKTTLPEVTADNIDDLYDATDGDGYELQDARNEVRCSGAETGLRSPISRNYESDAVAAQAPDGTWVGWTYWYGGGKHSEPEAIDWIDEAYDVTVTEEPKTIIHRTFTKVEVTNEAV
jgi:hypothetical protein